MTNSAYRILTILRKSTSQPENIATAHVWASLLELDKNSVKQDPYLVYAQLQLIREEVKNIEQLMSDTEIPNSLYQPYLDSVLKTISITNISAEWKNYKKYLQPDVFLCLEYCAALIPKEESVDEESLQKIFEQVQIIKREIQDSNLSQDMRLFLLGQLEIIESAIKQYKIKGEEAIRKAFSQGFSDYARQKENDLKDEDDEIEVKKVIGVWTALKSAGNTAVNSDKIANAFVGLIQKGHTTVETLTNLIQGPS